MLKTVDEFIELLSKLEKDSVQNMQDLSEFLSKTGKEIEIDKSYSWDGVQEFLTFINDKTTIMSMELQRVQSSFVSVKESLNILSTNQSFTEPEKLFEKFVGYKNTISTEIEEQAEIYQKYKDEIMTVVNALLNGEDSEFKPAMQTVREFELMVQTHSIITNLDNINMVLKDVMNDVVKNSVAINNDNSDDFRELKQLISKNVQIRDDKLNNLEDKIDKYISSVDKITDEASAKINTSIDEITELKDSVAFISKRFADWDYDQDTKISHIVDTITSDLDQIHESISTLTDTVKMETGQDLSDSSENIERQITRVAELMETIKVSGGDFDVTPLNDIKDKIKDLEQKIEAINTETFDELGVKTEAIFDEMAPMKLFLEKIDATVAEILEKTISAKLTVENKEDDKLTEQIISLKELISENVQIRDDKFSNLEDKIDKYISNVGKISGDADAQIGTSVEEIVDLKESITSISKQFADWNYNQDDKTSSLVNTINLEFDKIKESILALEKTVKIQTGQDLSESSENIERQISHVVELMETIKLSCGDFDVTPLNDIKDKINAVKQEINLVNTDIIDVLNSKTEAILTELIPIKEVLENVNVPSVNFSESSVDGAETINVNLQNVLSNIKQMVEQKLSEWGDVSELKDHITYSVEELRNSFEEKAEDIKNTIISHTEGTSNNKITELLDLINVKVDVLADNSDSDVLAEIDEVKSMISVQRDLLQNTTNTDKFSEIQTNLEGLIHKIDTVDSSDLADMRESIIAAIVSVFEQISFLEESEDIKDFVEERTDAISQSLTEVKQEIKQEIKKITSNESDNYIYTLQDVESDIAKLRMVLNEISSSSTNEEISDISSNINKIVSSVEEMQNSLTEEQISQLKNSLEKLSEDVVSISSRTNKLLLSSDESYQSLTNSMYDFGNVVSQLEERIGSLDSKEITERVEDKLDNAISIISASANSDKVMRQALTYMGEWIDSASENFDNLKEQVNRINEIQNSFSERFDEQQERMDRLERTLEKILYAIEDIDDTKLTKKVDKIEKEMTKLNNSVEKLTSYVE